MPRGVYARKGQAKKRVHRRREVPTGRVVRDTVASVTTTDVALKPTERSQMVIRENKDLSTSELQFRHDLLYRQEAALKEDVTRLESVLGVRRDDLAKVQAELTGLNTLLESRR